MSESSFLMVCLLCILEAADVCTSGCLKGLVLFSLKTFSKEYEETKAYVETKGNFTHFLCQNGKAHVPGFSHQNKCSLGTEYPNTMVIILQFHRVVITN